MDEVTQLLNQAKPIFNQQIAFSGGQITDKLPSIYQQEYQLLALASAKRQSEFAWGRYHAHCALHSLAVDQTPIGRTSVGLPKWPSGICGSITHTRHYCVAAVAKTDCYASIGIDIERVDRVNKKHWPRLFSHEQIKNLEYAGQDQSHLAGIFFSAKEAFYKCAFPLDRQPLIWSAIDIGLPRSSRFTIQGDHCFNAYQGYYFVGMGHILTLVTYPGVQDKS